MLSGPLVSVPLQNTLSTVIDSPPFPIFHSSPFKPMMKVVSAGTSLPILEPLKGVSPKLSPNLGRIAEPTHQILDVHAPSDGVSETDLGNSNFLLELVSNGIILSQTGLVGSSLEVRQNESAESMEALGSGRLSSPQQSSCKASWSEVVQQDSLGDETVELLPDEKE